jgi:molecular chaperone GrpE
MSRPRPQEDMVREQLREVEEAAADGSAPAAPAEPAAAPAPDAPPAPDPAADASAPAEPVVDALALDEELAATRLERDQYLGLAQRTQADFENFRKRALRDNAAAGARAKAGLVRELLPVVDNLERALLSATEAEQSLAGGVRLVLNELEGVLARNGVERIEADGQPFDPTVHEALSTRSEEGADAGVVLEVVQKGYRLGDAVIRPTRVVVSA